MPNAVILSGITTIDIALLHIIFTSIIHMMLVGFLSGLLREREPQSLPTSIIAATKCHVLSSYVELLFTRPQPCCRVIGFNRITQQRLHFLWNLHKPFVSCWTGWPRRSCRWKITIYIITTVLSLVSLFPQVIHVLEALKIQLPAVQSLILATVVVKFLYHFITHEVWVLWCCTQASSTNPPIIIQPQKQDAQRFWFRWQIF